MEDKEFEKLLEDRLNRIVDDGVYDVTDIEFIETDGMPILTSKIEDFIRRNPDFCVAETYNVDVWFLLAKKPNKFIGEHSGSGFNYGSSNILQNCPKDILILAQND